MERDELMRMRRRVWRLCRGVAESVWGKHEPTTDYARAAARLLYMIAAHESGGFRWRRQLGFGAAPGDLRGAYSLWQIELGSIRTSVEWFRHRPQLALRAEAWLAMDPAHLGIELAEVRPVAVATYLQVENGDGLAALFARAHLMWITAEPIPARPEDQAAYAKRWWNTAAGKATAEDYAEAFAEQWLPEFGVD